MKLYEISDEYLNLLECEDKDIDIKAELERLEDAFSTKTENIAKLIRNLSAQRNALLNEANRLREKHGAVENRIEGLKSYLQTEMERIGKEKLEAGIFRIRLQNSPLSVDIREETKLPAEFKEEIITVKVDKKAIIDFIKETGAVPEGCFPVQRKHIRIY